MSNSGSASNASVLRTDQDQRFPDLNEVISLNGKSGLAISTRDWYCSEIIKVLKKYKKASIGMIIGEMRKLDQRRYPIQEERICSFLKYLRAMGVIKYEKSPVRAISSKWSVEE